MNTYRKEPHFGTLNDIRQMCIHAHVYTRIIGQMCIYIHEERELTLKMFEKVIWKPNILYVALTDTHTFN